MPDLPDLKNLWNVIKNHPKAMLTLIAILSSAFLYIYRISPPEPEPTTPEIKIQIGFDINIQIIQPLEKGNPYWIGRRYLNNKVVKGLEGYYYVLDLKHADGTEIIGFRPGYYTIENSDKRLRDCLANFNQMILQKIPKGIKFQLFTKGSADILSAETYSEKFDTRYIFREIEFYPYLNNFDNELYIPEIKSRKIIEPITNDDLPNLRAQFIKTKVEKFYSELGNVTILDGIVEPHLGEDYRNAILLFFIEHPK